MALVEAPVSSCVCRPHTPANPAGSRDVYCVQPTVTSARTWIPEDAGSMLPTNAMLLPDTTLMAMSFTFGSGDSLGLGVGDAVADNDSEVDAEGLDDRVG